MDEPAGAGVDGPESVTMAIVESVAAAEGVEPSDLSPRLQEVVDLDALERLVGGSSGPVAVTFEYGDWVVNVRSDSGVEITRPTNDG